MLYYLRTSIFESPAQTWVNTVNTVGIMGKGIAKTFKDKFPAMYKEYRELCDSDQFKIGTLHLWRGPNKWVLNFPTKTIWRAPSKLSYIEAGLKKFASSHEALGITSISFPPLGCGNGGLAWKDVRPLMESYLKSLPITVYVHDKQVRSDFVPEHLAATTRIAPASFENFLRDIKVLAFENRGCFQTLSGGAPFNISFDADGSVIVKTDSKKEHILMEDIEAAWSRLQHGVLSADQFNDAQSRRYKSYLFAVLAGLPYVRVAELQHTRRGNTFPSHGLFFASDDAGEERAHGSQDTLWQFQ